MTVDSLRAATVVQGARPAALSLGGSSGGSGGARVVNRAGAPGAPLVMVAKPCPVCKKPAMENPWSAGCGHQACYGCWMKALAGMACPVCAKRTHKRNLSKAYFQ